MIDKPETYHRHSIRLQDYDYSQAGGYFITICTHDRGHLFGGIVDGHMLPNESGCIVQTFWGELANRHPQVELDAFVVMPNHVHGLIVVGAIHESPQCGLHLQRRSMLLPRIVGWFKMNTAKKINQTRNTTGFPVWQRGYWEHIVRDEDSLYRMREYIINNPLRWHLDRENPDRAGEDEFDRWLAGGFSSVKTARNRDNEPQ